MKARPPALAAVCVVLALAVSACGGSDGNGGGPRTAPDTESSATPMAQVSAQPPAGATVVKVTVTGDTVSPAAHKVEVKHGEPVFFQIQADKPGELHVHSSPAQAIDYPAGASQASVTIDQPGVVEAEIEQLGKLVVQLEVR